MESIAKWIPSNLATADMTAVAAQTEPTAEGWVPGLTQSPVVPRQPRPLRRLTANRLAAHAAALQEGLRLYQTMFERSALGQLIIDFPTLRIDVVNRAFRSMTGFHVDDLVGNDFAMVFPVGQNPASDIVDWLTDGEDEGYSAQRFLQRREGSRDRPIPVI